MPLKVHPTIFSAGVAAFAGLMAGHGLHALKPAERRLWVRLWLCVLLAAMGLAVVCGCSSMPACIQALGQDTNSVSLHLSTPWGSGDYRRNLPSITP